MDAEEYAGNLRQAVLFIEGKSADLLRQLRVRMRERADALEFEQAAKLRDRIRAVEKTLEKQRMVSHWGADQDIFGLYREGGFIEVQVIFVRQGKLTGNQAYSLEDHHFDDEAIVAALLTQFYQGSRFVPEEILVPVELEDRAVHEEYLEERKGRRVTVNQPRRGEKRKLLEMALNNARQGFNERHDQEREREKMLRELQQRLRLRRYPQRIECYDISMIQGTHAVGSRVSFFGRRARQAELPALPRAHGRPRDPRRRLRHDVRGGQATLPARPQGDRPAGPHGGGRRQGAVAGGPDGAGGPAGHRRGRGGPGQDARHRVAAAGGDRALGGARVPALSEQPRGAAGATPTPCSCSSASATRPTASPSPTTAASANARPCGRVSTASQAWARRAARPCCAASAA